jgi:hypothetical protein
MTTKKDFIAAAKTIAAITDKNEQKTVANNFCDIFSKQNPRFDKTKFLKACNVQN